MDDKEKKKKIREFNSKFRAAWNLTEHKRKEVSSEIEKLRKTAEDCRPFVDNLKPSILEGRKRLRTLHRLANELDFLEKQVEQIDEEQRRAFQTKEQKNEM